MDGFGWLLGWVGGLAAVKSFLLSACLSDLSR
jgi:hypothetical protein